MIVGSGDRAIRPMMVFLYRSPDLRRWTYIGQLYVERCEPFATPNGVNAHVGIPRLFPPLGASMSC